MSSLRRSRALLGAALTTSAIVAVPATASALSLPPAGGELRLELKGGAAASLDRQQVTISATDPASRAGSTLTVPAVDVQLGRTTVGTKNTGSIVLSKGSRSLTLSDITTHQGKRVWVRATVNGKTQTILTALRKTSRATVDQKAGTGTLRSTRLALTAVAAREIREGLQLQRLGRGGFAQATGTARRAATPVPQPQPIPEPLPIPKPATGSLEWTQLNAFESTALPGSSTLNRTWLGYFTNSPGPGSNRGTFTPSEGVIGETVTPDSPRGIGRNYLVRFPFESSTVKAATKTGIVRFKGLVSYRSAPMPAGHGITVTIQNPRIEFDGSDTAKLYATGLRTAGGQSAPGSAEPYDDSQPIFTLDLGTNAPRTNADGTVTFVDAAPSVVATGYAFPAEYAAGSGPNRTPNTFGTFDITVPANGG